MSLTKKIPADLLQSHGIMVGDTLRVLAAVDSSFVVEISSADHFQESSGKAAEWVRSSLGSIQIAPQDLTGDPRMEYYSSKYAIPVPDRP
jgi:hypothetical protein